MFTTDLALTFDPEYKEMAQRFQKDPSQFEDAFARAWFKLTHRDMGPRAGYLGPDVPEESLIWQDPIPEVDYPLISDGQANDLKEEILASGLTVQELVRTAWASASTFRGSDMRGGANGARIALAPQKDWPANNPEELDKVLNTLEEIRTEFNKGGLFRNSEVSLADMIVLGGAAAIEKAADDAGYEIEVPFTPGRADTTQALTDASSFANLEPKADGFRNYFSEDAVMSPTNSLVDKADLLSLSVPEMTVLVGGMRALDANADGSDHGVFTDQPGTLTNDFFVNLLDMSTKWQPSAENEGLYEGMDRQSGEQKWSATPVDLIFGSNAELRAVAEYYALSDNDDEFVNDFVAACTGYPKGKGSLYNGGATCAAVLFCNRSLGLKQSFNRHQIRVLSLLFLRLGLERQHHVIGAEHARLPGGHVLEAVFHTVVAAEIEHFLAAGHGQRGIRRNLRSNGHHRRQHILRVTINTVDQPLLQRFPGAELATGIGQLPHQALGHQLRQTLQRAHICGHTQRGFLDGKERILCAVAAVRRTDQIQCTTNTSALDRRQHRNTHLLQDTQTILQLQHHPAKVFCHSPLVATHGGAAGVGKHRQIHACRKVFAGGRNHHHASVCPRLDIPQATGQLQPEILVHAIQRFRATELHVSNIIFHGNIERAVFR